MNLLELIVRYPHILQREVISFNGRGSSIVIPVPGGHAAKHLFFRLKEKETCARKFINVVTHEVEAYGGRVYVDDSDSHVTEIGIQLPDPSEGTFYGTAFRNPRDDYDFQVGYMLALGRAVENLMKVLPPDNSLVDRFVSRYPQLSRLREKVMTL